MSLKEALNRGLNDIPGCRTVCYVDMPSGLVLSSSSRRPRPQEVLDRIAVLAGKLFQSEGFAAVADGPDKARQFTVFGQENMQVFVQPQNDPEHVLCYVCDMDADPDLVAEQVKSHRALVAEVF